MKTLISIFAVTLALAFTDLAFAGDVTAAKTEADAPRLVARGMLRPRCAKKKRCKPTVALATLRRAEQWSKRGVGFGRRASFLTL